MLQYSEIHHISQHVKQHSKIKLFCHKSQFNLSYGLVPVSITMSSWIPPVRRLGMWNLPQQALMGQSGMIKKLNLPHSFDLVGQIPLFYNLGWFCPTRVGTTNLCLIKYEHTYLRYARNLYWLSDAKWNNSVQFTSALTDWLKLARLIVKFATLSTYFPLFRRTWGARFAQLWWVPRTHCGWWMP